MNDIIRRDPSINFSEIDGEVVMLSMKNSEYYGLDDTGSEIWRQIEEPVRVCDLIQKLLAVFDVEAADCENDTLEFVNELYKKDLIIKQ
jgi:hypothetical protein